MTVLVTKYNQWTVVVWIGLTLAPAACLHIGDAQMCMLLLLLATVVLHPLPCTDTHQFALGILDCPDKRLGCSASCATAWSCAAFRLGYRSTSVSFLHFGNVVGQH